MTNNPHHWCPMCDAGWVQAVTILPAQDSGMLCSECEAFWPSPTPITQVDFVQFSAWLELHGVAQDTVQVRRKSGDSP